MLILNDVLGFLMEYVLLVVDKLLREDVVRVAVEEILVLLLVLLVEEVLDPMEEDFEVLVLSTPIQYEYFVQKLLIQSLETAGFHLMKSACDILKRVSTELHESPDLTVYHLLQFEADPGCVGPDGVFSCPKTTIARGSTRTLSKDAIFKSSKMWEDRNTKH